MTLRCPRCQSDLEVEHPDGSPISCPSCQHTGDLAVFQYMRPPVKVPPPPVEQWPSGGGVARVGGALLIVAGVVIGLGAWISDTSHNGTHNIGLISDRETNALAALALIILGVSSYIMGQLDLLVAYVARLIQKK